MNKTARTRPLIILIIPLIILIIVQVGRAKARPLIQTLDHRSRTVPFDNTQRKLWEAAGYRTDMGSAATDHPPPKEMIRLYHLSPSEHAVSNITKGRLKVARLSDLNDPFELMALSFRYGNIRKVVRDFKAEYNSSTGLLCFSEDWTSPVMWSHYAAKHTGICLGFDVLRTSVEKVQYEEKRLLPELGESDDPFGLTDEQKNLLRRTKCHLWAYEEEQRMFVSLANTTQEDSLHFSHFNEEIRLAEVILGPSCEQLLEDVQKLTSQYHPLARTFSARLAFNHFKVVPKESTVP